jgi:hypothetical protein
VLFFGENNFNGYISWEEMKRAQDAFEASKAPKKRPTKLHSKKAAPRKKAA